MEYATQSEHPDKKHYVDSWLTKCRWEHSYYPVYYFPNSDIKQQYLAHKRGDPNGNTVYDMIVEGNVSPAAVTVMQHGPLHGYVKVGPNKADAWFEEDERVYVHPKDPYKRIQILQSSKNVRVEVDGVELANTSHPKLLYETGLPVRTYIPTTDVRLDRLIPDKELTTSCPYKVSE